MPNKHKLGVYLAPHHDPAKWQEYIRAIDPNFVRILMPGDAPVDIVSQVHQAAPEADISLRWWDLDDGGESNKRAKFVDPQKAAEFDVKEMAGRLEAMERVASKNGLPWPRRDQLWFNAANEPPTWEHALRPAIATYSWVGTKRANLYGIGYMAGEIAVGHPDEWPPTYEWLQEVFYNLIKYDGILALHEYWQQEGPHHEWTDANGNTRKDWGALAGRYTHLKANVRIAITEAGVEGAIYERNPRPDVGWAKFMDPDTYANQTKAYLIEVGKDSRIETVLPFITDYQDDQWKSFDTLSVGAGYDRILSELGESSPPDVPAKPPVEPRLPDIRHGGDGGGTSPGGGVVLPSVSSLDPFVVRAILDVESNGRGFQQGQLVIRFEARVFEKYISKNIFDAHFRYDPDDVFSGWYRSTIHNEWVPYHDNQTREWEALDIATAISTEKALLSTSMGSAQVMGFNYARCGFPSVHEMYEALGDDEIYHVIALYNYVLSDPKLVEAVRAKDWRTIATLYNGTGAVDIYAARLEKSYKEFTNG